MQPTLFEKPYTRVMRSRRIEIVEQVLEQYPVARTDHKELVMLVWIKELNGNAFTPTNIRRFCSSPTGVDRDRRRPEMLKKYPRSDIDFQKYLSYKKEFSDV